ncbi:hypothetical protein HGO97_019665 [Faecalicatena sp. AGMB00832]|uniref:Uncharacterized protein n=1 Tax=Faecalicatena faecalis TaxID=2726362 RepID=A0ABS6D965_9FIRM|nr:MULTISPECIES: hypothetical protein [Faecalicatena]MBU3878024.1 hypothetical protein [Faecalicatena faecalis]MCI6467700.1 hypothetical protein [Faecalicatena sp.]MDY5616951.1 hypothetical protein [Lachnospiraceae bacterium]
MQMSDQELLQSISTMMDEKLDARFGQVDTRFERMEARFEQVDTRLDNMVTKDYLDERLYTLENDLLREIDTVQEKANSHFARVERRIDRLETTVNTIKLESDSIPILMKSFADLRDRVKVLERIS